MNHKGGSQTDTLVKLVLIFFISLLSFSVGTFVGKQFSDSQHKLANLEEDYAGSRSTASLGHDDLDAHQGKVVTEKEVAEIAKEFVKSEREHMDATPYTDKSGGHGEKATAHGNGHAKPKAAEKQNEERHTASTSHNKTAKGAKTTLQDVPAVAMKVAQKESAVHAPAVHEDRHPSSLPQSVSSSLVGKYTVQVASYATEKEAESHAKRLASKGFPAFYLPADIKGKTWYRVSVGSFSARQQALEYKNQLLQQANLTSAIVQKVSQ